MSMKPDDLSPADAAAAAAAPDPAAAPPRPPKFKWHCPNATHRRNSDLCPECVKLKRKYNTDYTRKLRESYSSRAAAAT